MADDTAVDFLLEHLKQLKIYDQVSMIEKHQIKSHYDDLSSLRTFLKDSEMSWHEHEELNDMVIRITDMANEAKDIIDDSIVSDIIGKKNCAGRETFYHVYLSGKLINVLTKIKSLKKGVSKIYEKNLYADGDLHVEEEESIVGFDDDVEMIKKRLAGGSKQLDVISIVGMPGLGKTTLAKRLYHDGFIKHHFYIRGWTYVSQAYAKRDMLLSILSYLDRPKDKSLKMKDEELGEKLYKSLKDEGLGEKLYKSLKDEELGEKLYKSLKNQRYLIVMDDIWNYKALDDMKFFFPNDNNGSRIIITSRFTEVALHAKPDRSPHHLRFLTKDESWDLLKHKVFGKESCPPDLVEIGEKIAQKCQGLPLAIVVIAGLLRTNMKTKEWEKVSRNISSHIAGDLNTLELSYYHLPRHLRLCFLYFGAFPEDYEICARKLIWLWIAEGFIHQIGQKTLEDVANEYLKDLIGRSLVQVDKTKFGGGIRACRVHDLLRDLCIRKGKEENFMQQIYRHETFSSNDSFPMTINQRFMLKISRFLNPSSCSIPIGKQRRLCIFSYGFEYISLKPYAPHIRSLLCFAPTWGSRSQNISCICQAFKLLRVLDLSAICLHHFPKEILQLVLLKYLELRGRDLTLPESISDLSELEMLDVISVMNIIPRDIWTMVNLRHLRINGKNYAYPQRDPSVLHNLQTILQLCPSNSCKKILEKTPNLRKLGFYGDFRSEKGKFWFPNLHFLNYLETLKLWNNSSAGLRLNGDKWSLGGLMFPPNLRKLTLSRTHLDWVEMSTIGMLSNLEVLKLNYSAFVGPMWKTTGGGFERLKFLRLVDIAIEQWEASESDFPSLQQLVLHGCLQLKGIPLEIGNIPTLQKIEVDWCSQSTENSANKIQEVQQEQGNDLLKIHIKFRISRLTEASGDDF